MAGNHRSGRKPKPTVLHIAHGTYNATNHRDRADHPKNAETNYEGEPTQLRGLGADGRWLWKNVVDNTPKAILARIDSAMLFGLARWWQIWRDADREAAEGSAKAVQRAANAWRQFTSIASQFGMTPTARAKLRAEAPQVTPEVDPVEDLYARRKKGG